MYRPPRGDGPTREVSMRRFLEWVVRRRAAIITLTVLVTVALGSQITRLQVITAPNSFRPKQPPSVQATAESERRFASEYVAATAIPPVAAEANRPAFRPKSQRITARRQNRPKSAPATSSA